MKNRVMSDEAQLPQNGFGLVVVVLRSVRSWPGASGSNRPALDQLDGAVFDWFGIRHESSVAGCRLLSTVK